MNQKVLGIDLGTTNSVMAILEGKEAKIIPNAEGGRLTPSVVAFTSDGQRLVGQLAKRQAITNPERTIVSMKRDMGTDRRILIDGKEYTPQEISAMILQKMKSDAESYLGEKIIQAVITCPAYFSDSQRQATKDAGTIAGLEVLRIINEPTAAALAYGLDKEQDQTILVFDLGGGTFDVSILQLGDGVFEVLATSGNNRLGGDDFDERLIQYITDEFEKDVGIDLSQDRMAMQRLKDAAERAKIELSTLLTTEVNLPFITADEQGPRHLNMTISRTLFNELTADLVEKTVKPTHRALSDCGLPPENIDKIILVGGSTRIPAVQDKIKELLHQDPTGGVNPDECVAIGAAIQAGVLGGEDGLDVLLLDVTSLSLGIETHGGVFTRIIERNTTIPTSETQLFTTVADNQTVVTVHVLQGEDELATNNISLGKFQLINIPPAPQGIPQIEVTFDIDADGILTVSARNPETGKEQSIKITSISRLSKEQIDRMSKEAREHENSKKQWEDEEKLLDQAFALIYRMEKATNEKGDSIRPEIARKIQDTIFELDKAIGAKEYAKIRSSIADLEQLEATLKRELQEK